MKSLMIITLFIPLLGFAVGNTPNERDGHLSLKTIETARAADKLILVVNTGADVPVIFENEHLTQFVNRHFVVELLSKGSDRGSYRIYNQDGGWSATWQMTRTRMNWRLKSSAR